MEATISVIIPVYKVEDYLNQCVESVIGQTYEQLEILLIDDGSPDRCGALCDDWATKDSRIKVIHKENGGLSDARNAGLEVASGEYIAFVDSDDVIAANMLEVLVNVATKTQAEIVECNYKRFSEGVPVHEVPMERDVVVFETEQVLSLLLQESEFRYTVWNKLYKRELFDTLRFEKGKLHEDVFLTYQTFGACTKIAKINGAYYYYRQRTDSIMGASFSLRTLDSLEARKRQYEYICKKFPGLSTMAQCQLLRSCMYFGQRALAGKDKKIVVKALQIIKPIFIETYESQDIEDNSKQKVWYKMARFYFTGCCKIRNLLKIGI